MTASLLLLSSFLVARTVAAEEPAVEWRFEVGAQVDPHPVGIAEVGVRKGPLSAELLTDTVEVRFDPQFDHGRAWVAVRGEALAAGLMVAPWANGAPNPARALLASTAGPEAGVLWYPGRGTYVGLQGSARWYWFGALDATEVDVPPNRRLMQAEILLGWWTPDAEVLLAVGADWDAQEDESAPHVRFQAFSHPDRQWAPNAELRIGVAQGQSFITRTRVGGLNPYAVPLAGAAWAEFWVEDYVALRMGPMWRSGPWRLGVNADLATIAGLQPGTAEHILPWQVVWGLALRSGWRKQGQPWFVDFDAGVAPGVPRAPRGLPWSTWIAVGRDWAVAERGH